MVLVSSFNSSIVFNHKKLHKINYFYYWWDKNLTMRPRKIMFPNKLKTLEKSKNLESFEK